MHINLPHRHGEVEISTVRVIFRRSNMNRQIDSNSDSICISDLLHVSSVQIVAGTPLGIVGDPTECEVTELTTGSGATHLTLDLSS